MPENTNETVEEELQTEDSVSVVEEETPEDTTAKRKPKKVTPAEETQIPEGLSVYMSKIVYKSLYERNSRSVGLIQIRLIELGYVSAGADKRGFLSDGTKQALEDFSKKKKTGDYDSEDTVKALFRGTPVTVAP